MQEIEKLKKRLKKVAQKPKLFNVRISKVEKKRKKRIIHNPKEFSEKYLILQMYEKENKKRDFSR